MATNGIFAQQEQYKAADPAAAAAATAPAGDGTAAGGNNLSKDEVGWYFVEQYYTTLSKSPEKLHLFYGKQSQFVYGKEAEVANVSVGRQAIQERIKALDFQDCKVRVSNVDSQASFDGIVIQVIGETSNKSGEPKKFVQTFVLAQQPSGYFVLNDILRYVDEGEEEAEENIGEDENATSEAPAVTEPEPEEVTSVNGDKPLIPSEAVDEKLAEISKEEASVNGDAQAASEVHEEKEEAPAVDPITVTKELVEEDEEEESKPEIPAEPAPTPSAPATEAPAVQAPAPTGPPKPMTWASRAAAAAGPKPALPLSRSAAQTAQKTTSAAPATAAAAAANPAPTSTPTTPQETPAATATTAPAPVPAEAAAKPAAQVASGWQTAGAESKRQNRPQSIAGPIEKEGTMGYVKYVTEKVQEGELRAALAAHGELTYFDINRQKNCAFVEFKTIEGYQAAVAANPHVVNGENIVVEPRRPKSNAYGGASYGSGRGGVAGGRGRGGFDGNRGGAQGGRNNFNGQNRNRTGGGATRGGRGGAQQAA